MPLINVQIVEGRSEDMKRKLMQELAKAAIEVLNAPEQSVRVILTEVPPAHWGVGLKTKADM